MPSTAILGLLSRATLCLSGAIDALPHGASVHRLGGYLIFAASASPMADVESEASSVGPLRIQSRWGRVYPWGVWHEAIGILVFGHGLRHATCGLVFVSVANLEGTEVYSTSTCSRSPFFILQPSFRKKDNGTLRHAAANPRAETSRRHIAPSIGTNPRLLGGMKH